MKKRLISPFIAVLLVLFSVLAVTQRPDTFYPLVEVEVPDSSGNLALTFLLNGHSTLHNCEALTGNIARVTLANCKQCIIKQVQCLGELDVDQRNQLFSDAPLSTPAGRMPGGVIIYTAASNELALAACQATERQSAQGPQPVICHPANTPRPLPDSKSIGMEYLSLSLLALLAATVTSWLTCWLIVKYEHLHAHLSHDHTDSGPQKFHAVPTPRIGGLGVAAGLLAAAGVMIVSETLTIEREFGLLLLAGVPAFLGGLVEDVTKKVGVMERLLLTMVSGAIGAWLLGGVLSRLDIPGFDQALLWMSFAVAFTAFAVGGVANSINIIDGYNGLAAGFSIVVLAAIATVAHLHGDTLITAAALALTGSLAGFLNWNWPGGKIFLGDGGAYMLGFLLAELSVLLVVRHPEISPWFPMTLMVYPIFETLFTIYRRKVLNRQSMGSPDALHLHQLIYIYLARKHIGSHSHDQHTARNARVAPYLWAAIGSFAPLAVALHRNTTAQIMLCAAFCSLYAWLYFRILRTGIARDGLRREMPLRSS